MRGLWLILAAGMVWSLPTLAQTDACPLSKSDAADIAVGNIRSWRDLAQYRQNYAPCDDGGTAEASSVAVVHLLATKWDTLPVLQHELDADPALRLFLLRHINTTADDADLLAVRKQARARCPVGLERLCRTIGQAVATALH